MKLNFSNPTKFYVLAASGQLLDPDTLMRAEHYLTTLGVSYRFAPNLTDQYLRFAGTDLTRINAIVQAAQQCTDIRLFMRGGYGLSRILTQLPWQKLVQDSERNGGAWCGYSDVTAFLLAMLSQQMKSYPDHFKKKNAKPPIPCWVGPMLAADFGHATIAQPDALDDFTWQHLRLMLAQETLIWQSPIDETLADLPYPTTITGRLWGGNLAMINSLIGTPFLPKIKQGILFIEDINEHPYRIERLLLQLNHAGILQKQKALLIGSISDYKLVPSDNGYNFDCMVAYLREVLPIPVLTGLQTGHHRGILTLPLGNPVIIDIQGLQWRLTHEP